MQGDLKISEVTGPVTIDRVDFGLEDFSVSKLDQLLTIRNSRRFGGDIKVPRIQFEVRAAF
jgi:hypothetical protein